MNHPAQNEAAALRAASRAAPGDSNSPELGLLHPRVFIPFTLLALIWGSTWLVIRDQISVVPSSWSVSYRFILAAAGMFILAWAMKKSLFIDNRAHRWAMLVGALQFMINFNLVYAAELYVTSGLVAVLFALLIIPNAVLGKRLLGRPVARSFWVGSAVAMVGVAMLVLREYRVAPVGAAKTLLGAGLTIVGVICVSFANVLQASHRMNRFPIMSVLAWAMLYGALANVAWSLATVGAPSWDPRPSYAVGIFYLAIIGSVITFPLYFTLIRDIGPGKAAYTSILVPIVAMLLSTLFEG